MLGRLPALLLATTALVPLGLTPAWANPLGGRVVGGQATVHGEGTPSVTIRQTSDRAIINWKTFNIGAKEKTRFVQPSSSSATLNRVTGGLGPSQIHGQLSANGRVFVVNPDGILIGPGATIDTGSFLATTNDIRNADFMAGRNNFSIPGKPDASVVNEGTITAQTGGFAALVAPGVRNSGTITARLGKVALASGNSFSLDLYGDELIKLGVSDSIAANVKDVATGKSLKSLVSNEGKLNADGGIVQLTAVAARRVVDSVINTRGIVEANSIGTHNGMIVLGGPTAARKLAGTPAQTVKVSGTLSAAGKDKGTHGGKIKVTGESIALAGAKLDVSGDNGGGTVLIGGDTGGGNPSFAAASIAQAALEPYLTPTATTVNVDGASKIDASAGAAGDGGKVVVWADGLTAFNGKASARGGAQSGSGGFVETSGHQLDASRARVDTSAPEGMTGSWLLDPYDLIIDSAAGTAISNSLSNSNVTVQTTASGYSGFGNATIGNGDIVVGSTITWSSDNTLTLSAFHDISNLPGAGIRNTGGGNLMLRADNTGTGSGNVYLTNPIFAMFMVRTLGDATLPLPPPPAAIDFVQSTGKVTIYYNPASGYVFPTNYSSAVLTNPGVVSQLTAYMLVNDVDDLQAIRQNLSGNYALGKDVDASSTAALSFTPIGNSTNKFSGTLDGQSFTIDHLKVAASNYVGLFGYIGTSGTVQNLNLTNVDVSGFGSLIGGLAGQNDGTIDTVSTTGNATGALSYVGGLVGLNNGLITDSHSDAAVSGNSNPDGGLVGANGTTGTITRSYATGHVFGFTGAAIAGRYGGLVGNNYGTISQSYAAGDVDGLALGHIGGFVAANEAGTITNSYATGAVTGGSNNTIGGFAGYGFGTISSSYSSGSVSGTNSFVGGFLGYNGGGAFSNNHWDIDASGQSTSVGATGRTTTQLKASLPTGFSPSVWKINSSVNNGYPYLKWQTPSPSPAASSPTTSGSSPTTTTKSTNTTNEPFNASNLFGQLLGRTNQFTQAISTTSTTAAVSTPPVIGEIQVSTLTSTAPSRTTSPPSVPSAGITGSIGGAAIPSVSKVIDSLNLNASNRYYTPVDASSDEKFMEVVRTLGLKTDFDVTNANYSSNVETSQSSGGNGTAGYIYPPGSKQNREGWAECVSLVVALKDVSWSTSEWTPANLSVADGGAKPGDAIATFDADQKYSSKDQHAAIFVGYDKDDNENIIGWYMLDQNNVKGGGEKPASIRYYPANRPNAGKYYTFSG